MTAATSYLTSIWNLKIIESNDKGLTITKDEKTRSILNFTPIIRILKKKQWFQRDLSLRGKVLITKAEGLS